MENLKIENKELGEKRMHARKVVYSLELPKQTKEIVSASVSSYLCDLIEAHMLEVSNGEMENITRSLNDHGGVTNPHYYGCRYIMGMESVEVRTTNGSRYYVKIPIEWLDKLREELEEGKYRDYFGEYDTLGKDLLDH